MYKNSSKSSIISSNSSISSLPNPVTTRNVNKNKLSFKKLELSRLVKLGKYLGRLFKLNHMDFEFALWQMIYLFISPHKVFRNTIYRKQTKNRYSRDDPAFLVLLLIWFIISATLLSLILKLSFWSFIKFLFYVSFIDCIGVGLIVATCFWLFTNKFLIKNRSSTNDDVEWAFSFDVHLNAFFPPLVIIHCFQMLIYSSKFFLIILIMIIIFNSISFLSRSLN